MEPYKLRHWGRLGETGTLLHSCARPGRSSGADAMVPDGLVMKWLAGLPQAKQLTIVSLLGRKHGPNGASEFRFYSFCGSSDSPDEQKGRLRFQQWLHETCPNLDIDLVEHPTFDFCKIPEERLKAIASTVVEHVSKGRTVVLVDSGGETRTKAVCRHLNLVEVFDA
jgi:hypothetical protein